VQYIPGHIEPFVDLILGQYLPVDGPLLDLGGGGLRFAVPAAMAGRQVTVVDVDGSSLDVEFIVRRVNEVEGTSIEARALRSHIDVVESDIFDFLRSSAVEFSMVAAFRVIHFLTAREVSDLVRLMCDRVRPGGNVVLSAISPFVLPDVDQRNELYTNSAPINDGDDLHRRMMNTPDAQQLRREQNLPQDLLFIDTSFVAELARQVGFDIVVEGYQSTRVVAGYVLQHSDIWENRRGIDGAS
jgi:SAM-dependent methyltransferase